MKRIKHISNYSLFAGLVYLFWHTHEGMVFCGPGPLYYVLERLVPSLLLIAIGVLLSILYRRKFKRIEKMEMVKR